jgi:hypothetical protein
MIPPEKLKPLLDRETTAWVLNRSEKALDEWATKWHRGDGYGPAPTVGDDGRVLGYSLIEVATYIYNHTLPGKPADNAAMLALSGKDGEAFDWEFARGRLALLFGVAEILGLQLEPASDLSDDEA